MISVDFQGKSFNITVIQVYALTSNAEEAEAETPILWPPDAKNRLIGKDPYAGKIEGGRRG